MMCHLRFIKLTPEHTTFCLQSPPVDSCYVDVQYLLGMVRAGGVNKYFCFSSQIKAFEKMDHLARAQRMLELQEAESARVSNC